MQLQSLEQYQGYTYSERDLTCCACCSVDGGIRVLAFIMIFFVIPDVGTGFTISYHYWMNNASACFFLLSSEIVQLMLYVLFAREVWRNYVALESRS